MTSIGGRIISIQLLRAIAAATVAVLHQAFGFADHIGKGLGLAPLGSQAAQVAVAVFLLLSGYVMVTSTARLTGRPHAASVFWKRRIFRILPPYWMATLLLAIILVWRGIPVDLSALARSVALIPAAGDDLQGRPAFFLWPGWTLFYEMAFYAVFGLGLLIGPKHRVAVATAFLLGLVGLGAVQQVNAAWLFSLTRPVILIFVAGMALAVWRADRVLSFRLRILALCLAAITFVAIPPPDDVTALDFRYLAWAGIPAVLICLGAVGGPLKLPLAPVIDRLGNSSYALYLLHVPLAQAWIGFFPLRLGPWAFLISLLAVTYAASMLFHLWVERPVTDALNRYFGALPDKP